MSDYENVRTQNYPDLVVRLERELEEARRLAEHNLDEAITAQRERDAAEAAAEEARQEAERLNNPEQWTEEERKRFLFGATKASYAEGTRAGCEELSIAAAEMSVELDQARADLAEARQERDRIEAVVNAARELELRARSTSDRPTMNGLRRALSLLDSQEEGTP